MTAADCLLLPLLERTEAVVPYFFGEDALQRCQFGRVQKMLKAARSSTVFGDLASDATTLARTNVEYASPLFRPEPVAAARIDATDPELVLTHALTAASEATRDAASRLCANHEGVCRFAIRSSNLSCEDAGLSISVDLALRHVAALMLSRSAATEAPLQPIISSSAADCITSSAGLAPQTPDVLEVFALKVGVPRDMDAASARALRAYLRLFAAAIRQHT
ncbi:hypothetical protein CYMTET_22779 [Cymbomonas tetramitiformis]|uniref:Uncharacterized protein n=1 Tax=Cymbomonas tetramitiformis TaxID=36881 RepID=A0AAE0G0N8_9CHLO|nr:hypothetical protein CYMTET_22779 [Cymbomonas tetramitiformis]